MTNKEDFGKILDYMVEEICKEYDISVRCAIKQLADYYEMSIKEIRNILKSIDSRFTRNNSVEYFDGDVPVRRTNFRTKYWKVMKKIIDTLSKQYNIEDADFSTISDIICCQWDKKCR